LSRLTKKLELTFYRREQGGEHGSMGGGMGGGMGGSMGAMRNVLAGDAEQMALMVTHFALADS
jgi:hypothetical protein